MLMRRENFPMLLNDRVSGPSRFSDWMDELMDEVLNWNGSSNGRFVPELNVFETDKAFELSLGLPGMKKEDFVISYENGLLTISGERRMEQEDDGRKYHRVESRFGQFSRSLPLPGDIIDENKIDATYDNGILKVTIPKVKEKAGRKIKVN